MSPKELNDVKKELNDCKNKKEFEIYFESINIIKKYVDRKIFPDYNYDIELKNFKMNELIKDLFSNKREEINQSIKDTFLDLLEEPSIYHTFFVILSKLRSNGSFSQPKSLIDTKMIKKKKYIYLNLSKIING